MPWPIGLRYIGLGAPAAKIRSLTSFCSFGLSPRPPWPSGKCTQARPLSNWAPRNVIESCVFGSHSSSSSSTRSSTRSSRSERLDVRDRHGRSTILVLYNYRSTGCDGYSVVVLVVAVGVGMLEAGRGQALQQLVADAPSRARGPCRR